MTKSAATRLCQCISFLFDPVPNGPTSVILKPTPLRTQFESIAERKLRRPQLTEAGTPKRKSESAAIYPARCLPCANCCSCC